MLTLLQRAFSEEEARSVASWSYPPPFDWYNMPPQGHRLLLARSADGEGYYPALGQNQTVVAFAVFGAEARVRGQEAVNGTLDLGFGVRPNLCVVGTSGGGEHLREGEAGSENLVRLIIARGAGVVHGEP